VHIFGLLYVLYYWLALKYLDSHQIGILILLTFIVFFIAVDYFRIIKNKRIPIVQFLWRKKEKDVLGGQVYYVLGITIALAFFEFQIALAVILMTVLGDTAAAIFGIAFGKLWIKKL
jgi:dolichol kinase